MDFHENFPPTSSHVRWNRKCQTFVKRPYRCQRWRNVKRSMRFGSGFSSLELVTKRSIRNVQRGVSNTGKKPLSSSQLIMTSVFFIYNFIIFFLGKSFRSLFNLFFVLEIATFFFPTKRGVFPARKKVGKRLWPRSGWRRTFSHPFPRSLGPIFAMEKMKGETKNETKYSGGEQFGTNLVPHQWYIYMWFYDNIFMCFCFWEGGDRFNRGEEEQ